jgi:hypothetical protein
MLLRFLKADYEAEQVYFVRKTAVMKQKRYS